MSDHEHIDRIWAIIEKVGVCMLTTRFDVECAKRKFGHAHQYEWRSSAPASKKCCDATITGP
jgi:hypothetical protein